MQTTSDFEVIIANDCPARMACEDIPSVHHRQLQPQCFHTMQPSLGPADARNEAARRAKGTFLLFLDHDDLLSRGAIETMALSAMLRGSRWVYSGVKHFGSISHVEMKAFEEMDLRVTNELVVTCLLDRELFFSSGMFDIHYEGHEDWDFWQRLLSLGHRPTLVPEALFFYRRHDGSRAHRVEAAIPLVRDELSARNAALFSTSPSQWLPFRSEVAAPAPDAAHFPPLVRLVVDETRRLFRSRLAPSVPFRSYRRPNEFLPFEPRAWASDKRSLLFVAPLSTRPGGAERVDLDILAALRDNFTVTVAFERIPGGECAARHPMHAEYADVSDWIVYLENVSPSRDCAWGGGGSAPAEGEDAAEAEQRKVSVLAHLVTSRAVDTLFVRNSYVGYAAARHWRMRDMFPHLSIVDLIHLYEARHGAWERYSAPFHEYLSHRFVISHDLKRYMVSEYELAPSPPITVIPNGASVAFWQRPCPPLTTAASSGPPKVVFVGRLEAQKQPLRFVAIAHLMRERARFVMAGAGSLLSEVEAEIDRLHLEHLVELAGNLNATELRSLFCTADVLVMPSSFEGLPLVLIEAALAGVPLIASDVGAVGECLSRVDIALPSTASDEDFAHAVQEVLSLSDESKASNRQERQRFAAENFSLEAMRNAYAAHLSALPPLDHAQALSEYEHMLMRQGNILVHPQV
eukprot:TRINITY_DN7083_c0_g1_i2.p1 TRINITY_DN7083_c0_g1~~TRINITY_DN7083_c0_g1_i2.p1  ORF type:complete len:689 (+),score=159.30 TRINITY_DN7083_c0_g1_i2:1630-3696(+)